METPTPEVDTAGEQRTRHIVAGFLDPARRARATHDLAALGPAALQAVASVLDGTARNEHGVPYRAFDEAVRCALVTVRYLGEAAAPLEAAILPELSSPNPLLRGEAAAALRGFPGLSEATIVKLCDLLEDEADPAAEAAATLLAQELSAHSLVQGTVTRSARARAALARRRASPTGESS